MGSALRPLVVKSGDLRTAGVVTLGNFFPKVVAVLLKSAAGVEVGFLGAVCDSRKVTDAKVDTCCFVAGCSGSLDFVFADEVEFPPLLRVVIDCPDLLQVLNGDAGRCLVPRDMP